MSSKFTRTKKHGGVEGLKERVKTPGTVDVGIIDAGAHKSSDLTIAAIGFINEFGAEINHPGGTPFIILGSGQVVFVKKGTKGISGVTKPHLIVIPERSFIRSTLHEQRKKTIELQKKLLRQILIGEKTTKEGLGIVGDFMRDKIQRKIISLRTPPNAPSTIRMKGSSNPLIADGQLKNSITFEVHV